MVHKNACLLPRYSGPQQIRDLNLCARQIAQRIVGDGCGSIIISSLIIIHSAAMNGRYPGTLISLSPLHQIMPHPVSLWLWNILKETNEFFSDYVKLTIGFWLWNWHKKKPGPCQDWVDKWAVTKVLLTSGIKTKTKTKRIWPVWIQNLFSVNSD